MATTNGRKLAAKTIKSFCEADNLSFFRVNIFVLCFCLPKINIYDVSNFINDYDEINQVMFYYKAKNCTYNIRIIPVDNSVPTNVENYTVMATGQVNGEGYTTATLSSPCELDYEYDKYAIIIEFVPNSSNSSIYLPAEASEYNNVTSQHVGAYL